MKLKLPKMKISLATQIGLYTGLIILMVVLAIGLISLRYSSNMLLNAEENKIENLAKSSAEQLKAEISQRLGVLAEAANND